MSEPETVWTDENHVTGYTIVAAAPVDVWRQQDSGLPGYVEWKVYEVEGIDGESGKPIYWKLGESSNFPGTEDLTQAEAVATGSVKWDGCMHMRMPYAHIHETNDLKTLLKALSRAYEVSLEMVGGGL